MEENETTWFNDKGNICLRWKGDNPKPVLWCLGISICVFLVTWILDHWIKGISSIILPCAFFLVILFFIWEYYYSKKNEALLLSLMNNKIDQQVMSYLKSQGNKCHELKRKLYIHSVGTYGKFDNLSVLVLLSNEDVLEYELICHPNYDDTYYELSSIPTLTQDENRIKDIHRLSLRRLLTKISLSDEGKLNLSLFLRLIISSFAVAIGACLIKFFGFQNCVFSFVIYICVLIGINFIVYKGRYKLMNRVVLFFNLPMVVVWTVLMLGQPVIVIIGAFFFITIFISGVIVLFIKLICLAFGFTLSYHTVLFLILSLFEIVCVYMPSITSWIIRNSPLRNWGNYKYESYQEDLAIYITRPKNLSFIFSLSYVIFLSLSTFWQLEYHTNIFAPSIENAVMKAFLVFLSFSVMSQKYKAMDISAKDLLHKIDGLAENNGNIIEKHGMDCSEKERREE